MSTTIQISNEVKKQLDKMKIYNRETYNDIIERMLEDDKEISESTKKEIEAAWDSYKSGDYRTHNSIKKEFGF